jgi:hypothetical protein
VVERQRECPLGGAQRVGHAIAGQIGLPQKDEDGRGPYAADCGRALEQRDRFAGTAGNRVGPTEDRGRYCPQDAK